MKHRDGKKFRGGHTSLTDLAFEVVRIVERLPKVTGISPDYIELGKNVSGGSRKIKIADERGGILLTVRQSRSVQDVWVYSPDIQATKLALARALRDRRIPISFRR